MKAHCFLYGVLGILSLAKNAISSGYPPFKGLG
jgi:hypothetical protein